jgi:predicted HTH domain antitoxin
MTVTLEIPEDVASRISSGSDVSRTALESVALEGYRSRRISEAQVMRLLKFDSRFALHAWLAEHDMPLNYDVDDLRDDMETLGRLKKA